MNDVMAGALFHLAFPVADIAVAKEFYVEGLGCEVGRETPGSAIFNLYGHQLVAHVTQEALVEPRSIYPRHFGVVFDALEDWQALCDRARGQGVRFYQEPKLRFLGKVTEHHTFFLADPFHNLLEFKHYSQAESIFGARQFGLVGEAAE